MRVCSVAGCPEIYPRTEGTRCQQHRAKARAARTDNAVYSSTGHLRFRRAVLTNDPICVLCGVREATVADHYPHTRRDLITMHMDPNDPQHGRGLCNYCHNKHTAHTSPGGWNNR